MADDCVHYAKRVESTVEEEGESMDVTLQGEAANIERVSDGQVNKRKGFIAANVSEVEAASSGGRAGCPSRKRTRDAEEESREIEKRGCEEGMSWWTCLLLGVSQDNTKPRVVKRAHNRRED